MDNHKSLLAVYNNPAFSEFGKPCDENLKTEDGTEFQVYKEPLSSQSMFFKALFSFDGTVGKTSVIPGIQPDILEAILIYIYTGHISLNTENIMRLYVASDFLAIESLKRECKMFVLQNMTYKNCVDLFLTANIINGLDLENGCRRFLLICFEKAVKHSKNKAYDLSYNSIISILHSKSINVSGERSIWSFIEAWVLKDPSDRMLHVPELLRCFSLNEIDEELASDMISSPIIRENELYENIRGKSKSNKISSYCNGVPFTNGVRVPPRLYLVTNGFSDRAGADLFISYDENLDVWRKLGKTVKPLKIVRVDHRVYFIKSSGGIGASVYDLLTGKFKPLMGPTFHDYTHYVEASGHLYAVMGSNVHQYDADWGWWFEMSSMQHMFVTGAVSLNGLIYAIGTGERQGVMQVYDPSSDRWRTASPPPTINALFTRPVVYREKIFLIDWTDVEVYDPVQEEWEVYPKLPFKYDPLFDDVVIVKGRLYLYKKVIKYTTDRAFVVYWDGSGEWKLASHQSCLMNTSFCIIEGEGVVREVMKKNKAAWTKKWKMIPLEEAMSLTTEVTQYSRG